MDEAEQDRSRDQARAGILLRSPHRFPSSGRLGAQAVEVHELELGGHDVHVGEVAGVALGELESELEDMLEDVPEDVVVPEYAESTTLGYPVLNPNFDSSTDYVPRDERPEWGCVGLVGKLRIRRGQVIGDRWLKMRDINDEIEEWLVR